MGTKVYSYDEVFAAMCMMEEIADPNLPDAPRPWEAYREQWGINGLRSKLIEIAHACDAAWTKAQERYDIAYTEYQTSIAENGDGSTDREKPECPESFDYDFVPFWMRECVDWSDINNGPRVRGS